MKEICKKLLATLFDIISGICYNIIYNYQYIVINKIKIIGESLLPIQIKIKNKNFVLKLCN